MNWMHEAYRDNLERFRRRDGFKALVAYGLVMGSCFFQGWLYTTDLSVTILNLSQLWIALFFLVVCTIYMIGSKEGWGSIGITTSNGKRSILLGVLGGGLLLGLHGLCDGVYKKTNCLWGSIVLHIIYNAVGAMVVFQ